MMLDPHECLARLDEQRSKLAARVAVLGEWDGLTLDEVAARQDEYERAQAELTQANLAFRKLETLVYTLANGLDRQ